MDVMASKQSILYQSMQRTFLFIGLAGVLIGGIEIVKAFGADGGWNDPGLNLELFLNIAYGTLGFVSYSIIGKRRKAIVYVFPIGLALLLFVRIFFEGTLDGGILIAGIVIELLLLRLKHIGQIS